MISEHASIKSDALKAVRILAGAVTLMREQSIKMPDAPDGAAGIEPAVLLPGWTNHEIASVLRSGLFNDEIYGTVRFRHRETRELLAAEFFEWLLKCESVRSEVEGLIFRNQYGVDVISPVMRTILPWLVVLDERVRERALAMHPEIALEGGDPASLPLELRQEIFAKVTQEIASEDTKSGYHNNEILRIARSDLADDAKALIEKYGDNDDVIFFLGRFVWLAGMESCIPLLAPIAADPNRGKYARIAATRAVALVGSEQQRRELWTALNAIEMPMRRALLAELLSGAQTDAGTVDLVLRSIELLPSYKRFDSSGLGAAIHQWINRFTITTGQGVQQPLAHLATGLNSFLNREPFIERRECRVSEEFKWLLGPATHAVERLISARAPESFADDALAIMLKMPAAVHWRDNDFDEYKPQLYKIIPQWPELNDALFWQCIADARSYLVDKSGDRVTDDRYVAWMDHYWRFDDTSFKRLVGYIQNREFLDDRLVALAAAFGVFHANDRPVDWSEKLIAVVKGEPELADALDALMHPKPSEAAREWKREESKYVLERKNREAQDKRARDAFIKRVKANPDLVRNPGLESGQMSNDQYWLQRDIGDGDNSRKWSNGTNWQALIPTFGIEVAEAYRDAALAHWRVYTPGLRSEGTDTSQVPAAQIFGLAGLEIESMENENFPRNLTTAERQHALRYLVHELNGFPDWFESMFSAFPDETLQFIWQELEWELAHSMADQSVHYILHDLIYYAPWLHAALAAPMFDWLFANNLPNLDSVRYGLHILITGGISEKNLAELAKQKIETNSAYAANWHALWVDVDPEKSIPALEHHLVSLPFQEAVDFAQIFVVNLVGERRGSGPSKGLYRTAKYLKALYVLMHKYIRAKDDINRADGGVYSPELRDDAQDARNHLFGLLKDIPGKESYDAMVDLVCDHPEPDYRQWMALRAKEKAIQDSDLTVWTAAQVRELVVRMDAR
jgi:hypothetical protein